MNYNMSTNRPSSLLYRSSLSPNEHVAQPSSPESARLAALRRYNIVHTSSEERFDRLTRLAADLLDTPLALITLIERDFQWFKSVAGDFATRETDLDISFCVHTIGDDEPLVVEDTTQDERFADNPLVTGESPLVGDSPIRFYAGAPLVTHDGHRLGALCVVDTQPRKPTPNRIRQLEDLAATVVDEIELRALYRHQHTILESITDAFFAVDSNWRFTYVNQQAETWLQVDREAVLGENIWDAFPEAVDLPFYDQYHKAVRENTNVAFEAYFPPLDLWFSVRAYPFEGGLSVYFSDITKRKKYEQALEEAKQRAETANASKSRFLAGVAHDLQTPLSVIDMQANLLTRIEDTGNDDPVAHIQAAVQQLQAMSQSLTELASLQSGALSLPTEQVEVRHLLHEATCALTQRASKRGITVHYESDDPAAAPLFAQAHTESLRRVIDNVLSNALDYSDTGDTVRVWAEPGMAPVSGLLGGALPEGLQKPDQIRITIADTGPGIEPKLLDQVFDPYVRGTEGEGSGLGLAVTRELIEAMAGHVLVRSVEGKGTTFYLFVPKASDS